MSLVVADVHPGGAGMTLAGETCITYDPHEPASAVSWPHARRSNPYTEGVLKLVIVRSDLCVGVANRYNPDRLRQLAGMATETESAIRRFLRESSETGTSYVVASLAGGTPTVALVRGGYEEPRVGRAWAGDEVMFRRLQHSYDLNRTAGSDERDCLRMAFDHVVDLEPTPTVGGFHVFAVTTSAGFRFVNSASVIGQEVTRGTVRRPSPRTLSLSLPLDDGDQMELVCCPGTGTTFGAYGGYIPQIRRGVLWAHGDPGRAVFVPAGSVDEFVARAYSRHGQELAGWSIDLATLGISA